MMNSNSESGTDCFKAPPSHICFEDDAAEEDLDVSEPKAHPALLQNNMSCQSTPRTCETAHTQAAFASHRHKDRK